MIQSFAPYIDNNTKIVILGSMPGITSLEKNEYYAHPRNHFWKIIYSLFTTEEVPKDFVDKVAFLQKQHIGLWDVLAFCEREGSLDTNIKNAITNDFVSLFKNYPKIKTIVFNGKASYGYFYKKYGQIKGITYKVMPSTSPANTMSFDKKRAEWRTIIE